MGKSSTQHGEKQHSALGVAVSTQLRQKAAISD